MFLIDSNIIIYAVVPEHDFLRKFIAAKSPAVSVVSKIEVLGYYKLKESERKMFAVFFENAFVIGLSENITNKAVELRQKRNMTLADSIIAATALQASLTLVTRNSSDFTNISGLKLYNPFDK